MESRYLINLEGKEGRFSYVTHCHYESAKRAIKAMPFMSSLAVACFKLKPKKVEKNKP